MAIQCLVVLACLDVSATDPAPRTIGVTMITGHAVSGRLLLARNDVFVLEVDGFPTAISYDQLEPASAYRTRIAILEQQRGGLDRLTADDRFALGTFCLRRNRTGLAQRHFARAIKLDPTLRVRVDETMDAHRERRGESPDDSGDDTADWERAEAAMAESSAAARAAIAGYKRVGEQIQEIVGSDIRLLETPHFLIWTDWAKAEHALLEQWSEQMYAVVAERFRVPSDAPVFAGKCPVFCLRSKKRFREVARLLDDWDVENALGYTMSEGNGHVHVVVCRLGGTEAGRDIFASTMVHELSHAFLHRYRSPRRIPPWLNEGLANVVAEDVLGDRCFNAETAAATAELLRRSGRRLETDFWNADSLNARYYPVAHGIVAYLIARDREAFREMIDDVKAGAVPADALCDRFGLTYESLESSWRADAD